MIKSFSFLEDDFVGGKATKNTTIVPDLFFIESIDDKFIYYSSLLARVYLVDKEEKEIIEKGKVPKNKHKDFVDGKLLVDKDKFLFPGCNLKEKFSQPEDLFIFLTSNCNLRCQYCFASGGEKRKVIDFDFTKAGIDYVLEKNKEKKINLYFHGGGEPTLAFDLLKKIVSYAKSKADIIKLGLQTNGVAQKHVIDYLSNNKFRLSVSIDGPPSIQDKQRPQKGGGKSSFFTERTIKYLVQQNYPYLRARSTISQFSVDKQA